MQDYASRWGLGFLTFPEDAAAGHSDDPHSDNDGINSDKENLSGAEEGRNDINMDVLPEWYQRVQRLVWDDEDDIVDVSVPKNLRQKRCKVKLGTGTTHCL